MCVTLGQTTLRVMLRRVLVESRYFGAEMIANIMDLRERPYRWKSVIAVVESTAKDNVSEDADKVESDIGIQIDYAEKEGVSIREAIQWAERFDGLVTLYLYDGPT